VDMSTRIAITFDGATTTQVRDLAAALSNIGLRSSLAVGCDGPELWNGQTPKLTPNQFASVFGAIVKIGPDQTIAEFVAANR